MQHSKSKAAIGLTFAFTANALAHHSFVGLYDPSRIEEIEGRVQSVSWRNPHGSMVIEVTAPDDFESVYGFSRGHWEDDALVVETDSISAEFFDYEGTPQSADARYVERFVPTTDASRLNYRITVVDPATFTETFELSRYFVWRPELVVNPYDCFVATE